MALGKIIVYIFIVENTKSLVNTVAHLFKYSSVLNLIYFSGCTLRVMRKKVWLQHRCKTECFKEIKIDRQVKANIDDRLKQFVQRSQDL